LLVAGPLARTALLIAITPLVNSAVSDLLLLPMRRQQPACDGTKRRYLTVESALLMTVVGDIAKLRAVTPLVFYWVTGHLLLLLHTFTMTTRTSCSLILDCVTWTFNVTVILHSFIDPFNTLRLLTLVNCCY